MRRHLTLRRRSRIALLLSSAALALASGRLPGQAVPPQASAVPQVELAAIDKVFEAFHGTHGPGCAVGVSHAGGILVERAYGMADLEHDVANRPTTVFEPGSVSKQFTAAATLLLAQEGRLSLDDDVRRYIPELPEYEAPITVRHLIHHTSGLRDWGSVASIEGWPRTTRVHTHDHMLDIASRQKSLNYRPGEYYSYTNTGYNMQAVLVERVSGMSFAQFTEERLFGPLGMTRTEWRDDFTRVVKDRAVAYVPREGGGWSMLMPFENVHGNGGLLTTVGDLLRWTRNLETGEVGGPAFVEAMHRRGVLNSGRTVAYASGLFIGEYRGVREVRHSGGTAGYRGFLTRFPDQGIAVAVMCNAGSGNAGRLAHQVADLYLGDRASDGEPSLDVPVVELAPERLEALAGGYRDARTGAYARLAATEAGLRLEGIALSPVGALRFEAPGGIVLEFEGEPDEGGRRAGTLDSPVADDVRLEPVEEFSPSAEDLAAFVGTYRSEEAEATYTIEVADGQLVVGSRYGWSARLGPVYPDAFVSPGTTYIFGRDGSGRVVEMRLSQGRVWNLRFERIR